MLESFRTHKRWLMFFLMVLVIPSFVVTGIYSYNRFMGDENALAKVGDSAISPQEFDNAKRERIEQLRQNFGEAFDPKMLDTAEARAAILDSLMVERALTREAAKENLNVSEAEVVSIIKAAAPFQKDGKFDPAAYQNFLAARGRSDQQFVNEVRHDIARQQLIAAVGSTSIVPKTVASSLRQMLEETREVRELIIRPEEFLAKAVVSDEAIAAFYDKNKASFETPETLKVEYVVFNPESAGSQTSAPEAELKTFYEQNKARWGTEEQRRASHILLPVDGGNKAAVKKQADELVAKLRANPADFAKLAREFSKDPGSASNGGDLGFFGRNMMVKPFEEAVYKLKPGEISEPVETDFGFHVVRLSEIKPAQVKPFEEVRGEIEREYRTQQAQKKFAENAEAFTNMVYEQSDSLKPVIEKFKLSARVVDGVTRQGAPGAKDLTPRLIEALFANDALRDKRNTQAIEVAPNTLVSARVLEHRPAALRPLDEVKAQIKQKLQAEEAAKLARAAGEARLAELLKSPSDAGFGPAVAVSRANPQGRPAQVINADLRPAADKLPTYVGVDLPNGAYVISRVLSSKLPPADEKSAAEQQRVLAQTAGAADDLAYVEGLKLRHKATVLNPDYKMPGKTATGENK